MQESKISKELYSRIFELTLALYRVTDFFPAGETLKKQLREKANDIFGGVVEYGYSMDTEREALSLLSKIQAMHGYLEIARSMRMVKPINITVLEREYNFLADFFAKELETFKNTSREREEALKQVIQTVEGHLPAEAPKVRSDKASDISDDIEPLATWDEFTAKKQSEENLRGSSLTDSEAKFSNRAVVYMSDIKEAMSDRKEEGISIISRDINERQQRILQYIKQVPQAKISDFYSIFQDISSKTIQRDLQDLVSKDILKKEGEKRWTTYSLNNVR